MAKCLFDGCEKVAVTKCLCQAHYKQQKAGKALKPLQVQYHGLSESKRFLMRVNAGRRSECWEWTGSRKWSGPLGEKWHGQWRNSAGGIELAHRAAWRLMIGSIPEGMFVLHKCDNPICVNPAHMFLGTQKDNLKRHVGKRKGEPRKVARREAWKCKTHRAKGEGNSGTFDFWRRGRKEVWSCTNNHL